MLLFRVQFEFFGSVADQLLSVSGFMPWCSCGLLCEILGNCDITSGWYFWDDIFCWVGFMVLFLGNLRLEILGYRGSWEAKSNCGSYVVLISRSGWDFRCSWSHDACMIRFLLFFLESRVISSVLLHQWCLEDYKQLTFLFFLCLIYRDRRF